MPATSRRAVCGQGNLYLRGGGDPTFGSTSFIRAHYGGEGASVSALARQLVQVDGIHRVTGSIEGDESYFDSLRGEPSSEYAPDPFLEGTLSALAFNRGADRLRTGAPRPRRLRRARAVAALKGDGVTIQGSSGAARTPARGDAARAGAIPHRRPAARPDAPAL